MQRKIHAQLWCFFVFLLSSSIHGNVVGGENLQDRKNFTQCLRSSPMPPCSQWKAGRDFCDSFVKRAYLDSERSCYGQRWSVPNEFFLSKYIAYGPLSEAVILVIGRPDMIPGIATLVPGRTLRDKKVTSPDLAVVVRPLLAADFKNRTQEIRRAYERTDGLEDTGRSYQGFRIVDQSTPIRSRVALLFPEGGQWFLICPVRHGFTVEAELKEPGECRAYHNVDDRIYLEYRVNKSALRSLPEINRELVKLIRSFMVQP